MGSIMTKEEMTELCKAKLKYTVYSYRPIRIEDERCMGWRKRDQNTGEITQGLCLRALLNDKKAG